MTFEKALTALKQGKKVTRREFRNETYLTDYVSYSAEEGIDKLKIKYKNGQTALTDKPPTTIDIFSDDWEICGEENQPDKSGVSVGGLLCKVTSNFDEYEQALDIFKCRLEDLREAAEKLNGIKLDINIDFD